MAKHFHVVVWAAEGKNELGYTGVTYVDLIAKKDPQEALKRTRELFPDKKYYHINNVIEHDHPMGKAEER